MGKEQKSSTQNTFPPWLMNALRPLIEQQTQNMGTFSNQGFNVLQGLDYRDGQGRHTQRSCWESKDQPRRS